MIMQDTISFSVRKLDTCTIVANTAYSKKIPQAQSFNNSVLLTQGVYEATTNLLTVASECIVEGNHCLLEMIISTQLRNAMVERNKFIFSPLSPMDLYIIHFFVVSGGQEKIIC
jgi:hypothetical protein